MALLCAEEPAKEGDLVVAIDFGTTRSAVAYTVVGREEELVTVLKLSGAAAHVYGDYKTSTSLLLASDNMVAFGFEAEQKFAEDGAEHPNWALFKWFKMNLHKPFESDPLVDAFGGGGVRMRLSVLLQKCLEFVKVDVLDQLMKKRILNSQDATSIFWVLTIPAIWSDHAKFVMRQSAFRAGMISHEQSCHLHLALEPECAAIASQSDPLQRRLWQPGTKFLVADCGGGTLDITTHEVLSTEPLELKELTEPKGGAYGANLVDQNFLSFFGDLLGEERVRSVQNDAVDAYLSLVKEWEEKKVQFQFDETRRSPTKFNVVNLLAAIGAGDDFPGLVEAWNRRNPSKPVEPISNPRRVQLSLSYALMKSFFEDPVRGIMRQVKDVADQCGGNLTFVVLVGGFAKCRLLQDRITESFAGSTTGVVVANDPDLLIAKGAAMFGARPTVIPIRILRYTVGVGSTTKYDGSIATHRRFRDRVAVMSDGMERLDIFSVHGRVGEEIGPAIREKQSYTPIGRNQKTANIPILVTREHDVFHSKEEGVRELASTSVPFDTSLPFEDRKIFVEFSFGETEVRCMIYDASGENQVGSVPMRFNFFV